jgi:hypothetical protein
MVFEEEEKEEEGTKGKKMEKDEKTPEKENKIEEEKTPGKEKMEDEEEEIQEKENRNARKGRSQSKISIFSPTSTKRRPSVFRISASFDMMAKQAILMADKTGFLIDFYSADDQMIAVNLPRAFAKTTLLQMMRRFFEIKEDPKTGEKYADKTRSPNYPLFADRKLAVFQEENKDFCES